LHWWKGLNLCAAADKADKADKPSSYEMLHGTVLSVLVSLPEAVLVSILSSWMTATHVARLDSALCTNKFRSQFLSTTYCPTTILPNPEFYRIENATLDAITMWTLKKGAAMSMLCVTTSVLDNATLLAYYLLTRGKTVSKVCFQPAGVDTRINIITMIIAGFCPNVTIFQGDCSLDDYAMAAIAIECKLLKEIDVMGSCSDFTIDALARHCHQLTTITIDTTTQLSEISLVGLLRQCPILESIQISEGATKLTDAFFVDLAANCPNIAKLDLCNANLSDVGITAMAAKCLKLHTIYLSTCRFRATNACSAVAFQALQSLNIFGLVVDDAGLDFLLSCCPTLRDLDLSDFWDLTEAGLYCVYRCPLLHALTLCSCGDSVTDAFLGTIREHCSALRALKLPSCLDITDAGVCDFVGACRFLEVFELTDNQEISDAVLYALAELGSVIKDVDVSFCQGITSAGVQALLQRCPSLTCVHVDHCGGVSEEVKLAVQEKFKTQRYL
jgi:F-box/leucine-rich repeat protein 2/20